MKTYNTKKTLIVRCASLLGIGAFVIATAGVAPAKADGLNINIGIRNGRVVAGGIAIGGCQPVVVAYRDNDHDRRDRDFRVRDDHRSDRDHDHGDRDHR